MTFDTPAGTRGARQPRGPVVQWINKWAMSRARHKAGKMMGANLLVLTTIGRKSGAERETPVVWFPEKDGGWLIVVAAAGAPKNPAWYYNIAANPDNVQVELAGRKVNVSAEQLEGEEREEAWRQIAAASSRFARYQDKTDRELPIIRLVPRSDGDG